MMAYPMTTGYLAGTTLVISSFDGWSLLTCIMICTVIYFATRKVKKHVGKR